MTDKRIVTDPYRVMVVDDSAVIRGLFVRFLEADPEISVLASIPNGKLALEALDKHDVEIAVLDIEMPVMDGMTALPLLLEKKPGLKVLMASTLTRKNAEISLGALALGAADYVSKPSSTSEIHSAADFKRELTGKIKAIAAAARGGGRRPAEERPARPGAKAPARPESPSLRKAPGFAPEAIAIGSSTGGPQALLHLFAELDAQIQQPIMIAQHMPATFTSLLAQHIARTSGRQCAEGRDGEVVFPGRVYLAPGGYHMIIEPQDGAKVVRLTQTEPENFCRPAVDPMLRSLAKLYGPRLLVVMLTGMGHDGRCGSEAVVAAGGTVIAQDEQSSVVWGMPGAVANAGLCSAVLPLPEIASYVRKLAVRTAA